MIRRDLLGGGLSGLGLIAAAALPAPLRAQLSAPPVPGRSYRDAPEVDGLVLLEGDFAPGDFVRAKVTQALAYDLVAVPVAVSATATIPVAAPAVR